MSVEPKQNELNDRKKWGYYTAEQIDKEMYKAGEGIRLIARDRGIVNSKFLVIFQKVICPFHKVLCVPASISFRANMERVNASFYCTANGHRIDVSDCIKIEDPENE